MKRKLSCIVLSTALVVSLVAGAGCDGSKESKAWNKENDIDTRQK